MGAKGKPFQEITNAKLNINKNPTIAKNTGTE
jgi:hypothetical protein